MTSNLQFYFLINKENNTITIKREFAANRQLVWDCHTKSELLDQWFAPKPWKTTTKTMDFNEGGYWLYAMLGPEGEEHYGRMDYQKIQPIAHYTAFDGFCDAEGVLNPQLPRAVWNTSFKDLADNTLVQTIVTYASLTDLEVVIKMGMKEGLSMCLDQLDVFLNSQKQ